MESDSIAIFCFHFYLGLGLFFYLVLSLFFIDFFLPIFKLNRQIVLNKKLTAKEQAWILHPICLLWATQLTLFPRQSPGAVWKIFPCKHSFQMAAWVTLHLLLFPQTWLFQLYFSKLPYFQTSSQVVMLSYENMSLAITPFSYCFWLTFQCKTKENKSIFVSAGHHRTTRRLTIPWTMEQEPRNCRGKWP